MVATLAIKQRVGGKEFEYSFRFTSSRWISWFPWKLNTLILAEKVLKFATKYPTCLDTAVKADCLQMMASFSKASDAKPLNSVACIKLTSKLTWILGNSQIPWLFFVFWCFHQMPRIFSDSKTETNFSRNKTEQNSFHSILLPCRACCM